VPSAEVEGEEMQISIAAKKGVAVPTGLKEFAERKLGKLERLLPKVDTVEITCSRERQWRVVEIMINADGLLVRGEERAADMRSAIDGLIDKLERRIKRSRSRMLERYRQAPEFRSAWESEPTASAGSGPSVVRTKRFAVKPMTPEEAAAQMELLGHDFYVFTNAETEQVNVLYRRRDGNYGLIEPEF
jgi:putative sigma-54 modulation protein